MFKKRNLISKLYLKYTNKPKYKEYKWELVNNKQLQFTNALTGSDRLNSIKKITDVTDVKHRLNLIHSGNAGDIIYALPTIKRLKEIFHGPILKTLKVTLQKIGKMLFQHLKMFLKL